MSGFTESGFERKLAELNSTQVSIQTLSLWLLHHKKHVNTIVKVWYKEFLKAQEHRKLTFIYLVNDVIQNSKKKGGDFGKLFAPCLKKALEYMARNPEDKMKKSILHFESSYRKMWDDLHGPDVDELLEEAIEKPVKPPVTNNTNNTSSNNNTDKAAASSQKTSASKSGSSDKLAVKDKERERRKRHHHHHHKHSKEDPKKQNNASTTPTIPTEGAVATGSSTQQGTSISPTPEVITLTGGTDEPDSDAVAVKKRRARSKEFQNLRKQAMIAEDMNTIEEWETLEKMPSTDAATRGKIANLPPEVSDVKGVDTLCIDSDVTRDLQNKIKAALDLLKDYNVKLDAELEERKTEHQQYGKILTRKLEEMKSHVQSMPDLSKLPSVTDGLAPLPSAGDLFNI
ncbi:Regulation of nuclear pre-mRNA domain-containing protein 1B [Folsomia candida]|uniref:Regulation of nuclear pre-mRNA domain-containing protein 1B n=1 Tax=Folsomia candida TaxID=158441 RepID=A0A226DNC4_FOLCA|nr:Regulation of nuclear pre-mRNA domain-containing protein 1B [Folsomia candida]